MSQAQARIREAVSRNRGEKLTALVHHVTIDCLRWSFYQLRKNAATGIDGVTWKDYEEGLEDKLADLNRRVHTGAYRAAITPAVHTKGEWSTTTARHRRAGRQDCPASSGGNSHADL